MATMILMITTDAKVTAKKVYCQSSVSTLDITVVKIKVRIMITKAVMSLGNALILWPIKEFKNRNVTLGIMEAMLKLEAH